jgi:uncharacterized heparinase superfamily protein
VGLAGRGGHGHNDILSFELFLNGMNVVTDCGSYLYTASREWRNKFRSTAFHNVVQVDDEECNRLVSPDHLWILHNDAVPIARQWVTSPGVDVFAGAHSGYERLPGRVIPHRTIVLDRQQPRVVVVDRLTGSGVHKLHWRFHLDPRAQAEQHDQDVRIWSGDREVWLLDLDPLGPTALVEGAVSPSYGIKVETTTISSVVTNALPCVRRWMFSDVWLSATERQAYARAVVPPAMNYATDSSQQ